MRTKCDWFMLGYITALIIVICTMIMSDVYDNNPTALDVYRGKTTLQITYVDSIPVDTVIVYKPKFRK